MATNNILIEEIKKRFGEDNKVVQQNDKKDYNWWQRQLLKSAQISGNFGEKLVKGLESSADIVLDVVGSGLGLVGLDKAEKGIADFSKRNLTKEMMSYDWFKKLNFKKNIGGGLIGELSGLTEEDYAQAYSGENANYLPEIVDVISEQAGNMLSLAASAKFGGNVGLVANVAGGSAEQALQQGASLGEATTYGLASGVVEAAAEKVMGNISQKISGGGSGKIAGILGNSAVSGGSGGLGTALLRIGRNFTEEGLEEVLSDVVNPVLQMATYKRDVDGSNFLQKYNTLFQEQGGIEGITESFLLGGLMGGIMETGSTALGSTRLGSLKAYNYTVEANNIVELNRQMTEALADGDVKEYKKLEKQHQQAINSINRKYSAFLEDVASGKISSQKIKTEIDALENEINLNPKEFLAQGVADKIFNGNVKVAVSDDVNLKGSNYDPNTKTITLKSSQLNVDEYVKTLSHELKHAIDNQELNDILIDEISKEQYDKMYKQYYDDYYDEIKDLSLTEKAEYIRDEIAADIFGGMFNNTTELINALNKVKPNLISRIKTNIINMFKGKPKPRNYEQIIDIIDSTDSVVEEGQTRYKKEDNKQPTRLEIIYEEFQEERDKKWISVGGKKDRAYKKLKESFGELNKMVYGSEDVEGSFKFDEDSLDSLSAKELEYVVNLVDDAITIGVSDSIRELKNAYYPEDKNSYIVSLITDDIGSLATKISKYSHEILDEALEVSTRNSLDNAVKKINTLLNAYDDIVSMAQALYNNKEIIYKDKKVSLEFDKKDEYLEDCRQHILVKFDTLQKDKNYLIKRKNEIVNSSEKEAILNERQSQARITQLQNESKNINEQKVLSENEKQEREGTALGSESSRFNNVRESRSLSEYKTDVEERGTVGESGGLPNERSREGNSSLEARGNYYGLEKKAIQENTSTIKLKNFENVGFEFIHSKLGIGVVKKINKTDYENNIEIKFDKTGLTKKFERRQIKSWIDSGLVSEIKEPVKKTEVVEKPKEETAEKPKEVTEEKVQEQENQSKEEPKVGLDEIEQRNIKEFEESNEELVKESVDVDFANDYVFANIKVNRKKGINTLIDNTELSLSLGYKNDEFGNSPMHALSILSVPTIPLLTTKTLETKTYKTLKGLVNKLNRYTNVHKYTEEEIQKFIDENKPKVEVEESIVEEPKSEEVSETTIEETTSQEEIVEQEEQAASELLPSVEHKVIEVDKEYDATKRFKIAVDFDEYSLKGMKWFLDQQQKLEELEEKYNNEEITENSYYNKTDYINEKIQEELDNIDSALQSIEDIDIESINSDSELPSSKKLVQLYNYASQVLELQQDYDTNFDFAQLNDESNYHNVYSSVVALENLTSKKTTKKSKKEKVEEDVVDSKQVEAVEENKEIIAKEDISTTKTVAKEDISIEKHKQEPINVKDVHEKATNLLSAIEKAKNSILDKIENNKEDEAKKDYDKLVSQKEKSVKFLQSSLAKLEKQIGKNVQESDLKFINEVVDSISKMDSIIQEAQEKMVVQVSKEIKKTSPKEIKKVKEVIDSNVNTIYIQTRKKSPEDNAKTVKAYADLYNEKVYELKVADEIIEKSREYLTGKKMGLVFKKVGQEIAAHNIFTIMNEVDSTKSLDAKINEITDYIWSFVSNKVKENNYAKSTVKKYVKQAFEEQGIKSKMQEAIEKNSEKLNKKILELTNELLTIGQTVESLNEEIDKLTKEIDEITKRESALEKTKEKEHNRLEKQISRIEKLYEKASAEMQEKLDKKIFELRQKNASLTFLKQEVKRLKISRDNWKDKKFDIERNAYDYGVGVARLLKSKYVIKRESNNFKKTNYQAEFIPLLSRLSKAISKTAIDSKKIRSEISEISKLLFDNENGIMNNFDENFDSEVKEAFYFIENLSKDTPVTGLEVRAYSNIFNAIRNLAKDLHNNRVFVFEGYRDQKIEGTKKEILTKAVKDTDSAIQAVRSSSNLKAKVSKLISYISSPRLFFKMLDGYAEDGVNTIFYNAMRKADSKQDEKIIEYLSPLKDYLQDKTNKKFVKSFYKKVKLGKIEATNSEFLTIHKLLAQQDSFDILVNDTSGLRIGGVEYKNLTEEDLKTIQNDIQNHFKIGNNPPVDKFLESITELFEKCKEDKMNMDKILYGETNVIENQEYFPIHVVTEYLHHSFDGQTATASLMGAKNLSFNQQRTKNKKPLEVGDILSIVEQYSRGMAFYVSKAKIVKDVQSIYQSHVEEGTPYLKKMNDLFNDGKTTNFATKYLDDYFKSYQGIRKPIGAFDKLRKKMVTYYLGANLKVVAGQTTSLFTAYKYVNMFSPQVWSGIVANKKELDKYDDDKPSHIKARNFDTIVVNSQTLTDSISRIAEKTTDLISKTDAKVIDIIWRASLIEQKVLEEGISEAERQRRLKIAQENAELAVRETQDNYSPTERSMFSRSDNVIAKLLNQFRSSQNQYLSMLLDEVVGITMKKKTGQKITKQDKSDLSKASWGILAQGVTYTAIGMVFKALLSKDDEEVLTDIDKWVTQFVNESIIGLIPIANNFQVDFNFFDKKEGESAISTRFNELQITPITLVVDGYKEIVGGLSTFLTKPEQSITSLVKGLGKLTGMPSANVINYFESGFILIAPEQGYKIYEILEGTEIKQKTKINSALEANKISKAKSYYKMYTKNIVDLDDNIINAMFELYKNGNEEAALRPIPSVINYKDESYDVDAKSFAKNYSKVSKALTQLSNNSIYKELDEEEKAQCISKMSDIYYQIAKSEVVGSDLDDLHILATSDYNLSKDIVHIIKISNMHSTRDKTKKQQAQEYLNKLRITYAEKLLISYLCGYKLSKKNEAIVKRYLKQSNVPWTTVSKMFIEE